jgi:hypothetical protein
MGLTFPEALKLVSNAYVQGIGKSIVTVDAFSAAVPLLTVQGDSFKGWREGTLPTGGAFIDDTGVTSEESVGTLDQIDIPMRRIVGNMDIDDQANDAGDNVTGVHLAKKVKATWRRVQQTMITGNRVTSHTLSAAGAPMTALASFNYGPWLDSSRRGPGAIKYTHVGTSWQFRAPGDVDYGAPVVVASGVQTVVLKSWNESKWIQVTITAATATANGETMITFASSTNEFEGLNEIVEPARVIDPVGGTGDAFSFALMDQMITNEKVRVNRAFLVNSSIEEKIYAAYRTMGGLEPRMVQVPGYGGGEVLSYRGVPVLVCDFIPSNENVGGNLTCSSLYLASMDADEGLFLGVASGGTSTLVDADPFQRSVLGFKFTDVGALEGKDARRTRVAFRGAVGLRSNLALVRKRGVQTA